MTEERKALDWSKTTTNDSLTITRILQRFQRTGAKFNHMGLRMDIMAAHNNVPLDLVVLLNFEEQDFLHDIGGIARHIDRNTGKLTDCFLPRCAKLGGEGGAQ